MLEKRGDGEFDDRKPLFFESATMRLYAFSITTDPHLTRVSHSPPSSFSPLSSFTVFLAPSTPASQKQNYHPRRGLLWFPRSLEAIVDLARNGQALSNESPRLRTTRLWIRMPVPMALQQPGKSDPLSCGYVDKVAYEIDRKDLCLDQITLAKSIPWRKRWNNSSAPSSSDVTAWEMTLRMIGSMISPCQNTANDSVSLMDECRCPDGVIMADGTKPPSENRLPSRTQQHRIATTLRKANAIDIN
ncbi:uncharacterized protein BT62DRAFT_1012116 [Guyanagaster necrorhizus]|uniref:Uncharacterized protein n=1 Tax=Guyanagaster necrorhizus TaxID=856835 RepID=A0A9P7VIP4_9AGAR|nr:uncharacterized protein BT62DRAFT_1012116 [Guyanagaster necrorhizus MCA 3950]KAG7441075.1 hypothetical protein BT62DRAFT_1012116 [Guyanagaster necrorhizus MCA 3950]